MATNIKPIYPPLGVKMTGDDGLVSRPWGDFFENCYRYQKPCYKDINIGSLSLSRNVGNAPDLIEMDGSGIYMAGFDGNATTEEQHGVFELQHDYKELTDIIPHFHWCPTDANSGNVKWQLDYYISQTGKTSISGSATATSAATGTAWQKIDVNFTTIDGSALYIGAQVFLRIYRDPTDAADTYAHDAGLMTLGVHYQSDLFGSLYTTVK